MTAAALRQLGRCDPGRVLLVCISAVTQLLPCRRFGGKCCFRCSQVWVWGSRFAVLSQKAEWTSDGEGPGRRERLKPDPGEAFLICQAQRAAAGCLLTVPAAKMGPVLLKPRCRFGLPCLAWFEPFSFFELRFQTQRIQKDRWNCLRSFIFPESSLPVFLPF